MTDTERPLADWTDSELREAGGSQAHFELERRRAQRGRAPQAVEDAAERGRRIARAHVVSSTGGTPEGGLDRMAARGPVHDRVSLNRRLFERSAARVIEAQAEGVARAQAAAASDRVTGQLVGPSGSGAWEKMVGRAHVAVGSVADSDPAPSQYQDPDSLSAELRREGVRPAGRESINP
jgi:hypothetical protein